MRLECVARAFSAARCRRAPYNHHDGGPVPDPKKLQAKLQKAEAEAERDRATLRAKAEKKVARIKNELRAEEARIDAKLERKREKAAAKLATAGVTPDRDRAAAVPVSKARRSARRA